MSLCVVYLQALGEEAAEGRLGPAVGGDLLDQWGAVHFERSANQILQVVSERDFQNLTNSVSEKAR